MAGFDTISEDKVLRDWNTIEPEPIPQPKGSDIFRDLYMRQVKEQSPQPTFDTTTPEYFKRAAKYNAIARGLSQLVSTASLAMGGSVNPATEDTKTPAYIQGHLQYLDNYRDKVEKYDLMNYNNSLRSTGMMYDDAIRQENEAKNDSRYIDQLVYRDKKDAENEVWKKEEWKRRSEQDKLQEQYRQDQLKLRGQSRSSGSSDPKVIEIIGTDKKPYRFTQKEVDYYADQASRKGNIEKLQTFAPHLFDPIYGQYDKEKVVGYELKKNAKDVDVVRAYIEMSKVNTNGFEAFYGKSGQPEAETKQPEQPKIKPQKGLYDDV
jgi:hypothetical protein